MKVVALVSGGKDSCYAMMECVRQGHEIVCLAHLHPPVELTPDEAEIDSFMYQSVGHNVVQHVAACMALPLVTQTITGSALSTDMDYTSMIQGDEVEDLYRLLEKVKLQFPGVGGVCSGAIFSSYQRNRVEHVCERLTLTSLGYLWRRDQEELLDEMIESGVHAILVKVAAIGLHPRKHLGRSLADLQPDLLQLQEKYQLNVCGEGGEYETLTLDCPLFQKRIVIDSSRVVLHSDDCFAPVAFLVVESCHLEDKPPVDNTSWMHIHPPCLPVYDPPTATTSTTKPTAAPRVLAMEDTRTATVVPPVIHGFRDQFHLSAVMSTQSASLTLEQEMEDVFQQVQRALAVHHLTLDDICFVHLYVQDIAAFAQLNAAYCQHLGQHLPPSRSCVEVRSLPCRVLVDAFAVRGSGVAKRHDKMHVQRDVLHVKSLSRWAPHCIGPYSQANILHRALVLLAGQIALLPESMALVGRDARQQLRQSLRNACRSLEALNTNLRHVCSAVVYSTALAVPLESASPQERHLDAQCRALLVANGGLPDRFEDTYNSDESDEDEDKVETRVALVRRCPVLSVQLSHLPRHALVEVELQVFTHPVVKYLAPVASCVTSIVSTGEEDWHVATQGSTIRRALCHVISDIRPATTPATDQLVALEAATCSVLCRELLRGLETALRDAEMPWAGVLHLRVFYRTEIFPRERDIVTAIRGALSDTLELPAMTLVPVEDVQHGAYVALQATAQDLDKLETDLWLRKQA